MGTSNQNELQEEERGMLPRAIRDVFNILPSHEKQDREFCVTASFIEIYKEEVRDLLSFNSSFSDEPAPKEIHIREDETGNICIRGLSEKRCTSAEELFDILEEGASNRITRETQVNEVSSRSHCVFTLTVTQKWTEAEDPSKGITEKYMSGKFHFVDLAGSERVQKTGNVGERFKESIHINSGLLALGNVISSLTEMRKRKPTHVPYRQSKITRILKDSLGGNARTVMLCCISPASSNFDESMSAVKYANRARNIRNKPISNHADISLDAVEFNQKQVDEMRTEILKLRAQNSVNHLNDLMRFQNIKRTKSAEQDTKEKDLDQETNEPNSVVVHLPEEVSRSPTPTESMISLNTINNQRWRHLTEAVQPILQQLGKGTNLSILQKRISDWLADVSREKERENASLLSETK
ncbi:Kinesin-like protein kif27, partial [Cichlidogyrus casuarinus]